MKNEDDGGNVEKPIGLWGRECRNASFKGGGFRRGGSKKEQQGEKKQWGNKKKKKGKEGCGGDQKTLGGTEDGSRNKGKNKRGGGVNLVNMAKNKGTRTGEISKRGGEGGMI